MNFYLQAIIALAVVVGASAISYNFFYLVPHQQSLSNCLKSYTSGYEEFVAKEVRTSTLELCQKGVAYSDLIGLGKKARIEARAQYADPDSYWVEDEIDEDTYRRVRAKVGLAY